MNDKLYKVKPCSRTIIFCKMEFIDSERGRPKLAFKTSVYVRQNELSGGVMFFKCAGRRHYGCKAIVNDFEHSHAGNVYMHMFLMLENTVLNVFNACKNSNLNRHQCLIY